MGVFLDFNFLRVNLLKDIIFKCLNFNIFVNFVSVDVCKKGLFLEKVIFVFWGLFKILFVSFLIFINWLILKD